MAAKRRRAELSSFVSVEGAEFFKVFMPSLSSHQLRIPPDFIKGFRKIMKDKVILKNGDGKTWYVDVKEAPNGVFLKDGWQSFVDYHGLKAGEFLVFRYVGSFSFLVQIFGINGCKKGTLATCVKSEETSDSDKETEPKQTSRKLVNHSTSVDRRSCKRLKRFGEVNEAKEVISETCDRSENYELNETRKRLKMAIADISGTNPSFSIVLVHKGSLCVPVGFWRAHMEMKKRSRKDVTLWVENQAWNVEMVIYDGRRLLFQKGWPSFVKDNSLQVGTSCTFQLFATNHLSFKVMFTR